MNTPVDMTQFIVAKSDQLNSDDLLGGPRTVTITAVKASPDSAEQPVSIYYQGDGGKPFKPCKTMRRVMVAIWGADASQYVGRSMTLIRDPKVSFGGMQVGGIRISHMSHMDKDMVVAVMVTRGKKAPYKVAPLVQQAAQPTSKKAAEDARTKAEKWTQEQIALIAQAPDSASLIELDSKNSRTMSKLYAEHADLYDLIKNHLNNRHAAFHAAESAEVAQP